MRNLRLMFDEGQRFQINLCRSSAFRTFEHVDLTLAGAAACVLGGTPHHWHPTGFAERTLPNAAGHGRLLHISSLINLNAERER